MDPEKTQSLRRLSAIMFSDIVGYSRKMGTDELATLQLLKIHNEVMQRLIGANQGRIIKTAGDGVMASFDSAVNAVRCAAGIQQELRAYNSKQPEQGQIWVRIGIHLGDVLIRDNDMFGDGVNIASRIEPLAEPGGICISQAVYQQVKNKIQLETVYLGPHDLKNIAEQIELYHLVLEAHDKQRLQSRQTARMRNTAAKKPRTVVLAVGAALLAVCAFVAWQVFGNSSGQKHSKRTEDSSRDGGGNPGPANSPGPLALIAPIARELFANLPESDRGPFKDFNLVFFESLEKELEQALGVEVAGYEDFKKYLSDQGLTLEEYSQRREDPQALMTRFGKHTNTVFALQTVLRITKQPRIRLQLEIDWELWNTRGETPVETAHGSFSTPLQFPHPSASQLASDFSRDVTQKIAKQFKKD